MRPKLFKEFYMKSAAMLRAAWFTLFIFISCGVAIAADSPKTSVEKEQNGFVMQRGGETLHVFVCVPLRSCMLLPAPAIQNRLRRRNLGSPRSCPATPFEFKSDG